MKKEYVFYSPLFNELVVLNVLVNSLIKNHEKYALLIDGQETHIDLILLSEL